MPIEQIMKKNATKLISLLLTLCMVCSMLVMPSLAAETYTVTVVPGGYEVKSISSTTIPDGGSFAFSLDLNAEYSQCTTYSVYANSTRLTPDSSGVYTVSDVHENITIIVYNLAKNTYTVTFNLPDGTTSSKTGVEHGTALTAADYPSVTAPSGKTVSWDSVNPTVTSNMTITGTYVDSGSQQPSGSYTIHYELGGGSWASGTTAPSSYDGKTAITLPKPVKSGSTFLGWLGTGLAAVTADVVIPVGSTGNRTYVAAWSEGNGTYTVSFDMRGHGAQISPIANVAYGTAIKAPTAPTASGYKFAGWYQDAEYKTVWNFTSNLVTRNVTLYAKWDVDDSYDREDSTSSTSGYIRTDRTVEESYSDGVLTEIVTEKKTNIRTGEVTETVTTTIDNESNGINSVIIEETDENKVKTVTSDTYIYGLLEDEDDDDDKNNKNNCSINFSNRSGDAISAIYMATSRSKLDSADNLLKTELAKRKSVKVSVDLDDTNRWYFKILDDAGDILLMDSVTFEDAEECRSCTIEIEEDELTLSDETMRSGSSSRDADVSFDFDDDRTDVIMEQLEDAYKTATKASRDAEVNVTFFGTVEKAKSTEFRIPSDMVDTIAKYSDGHVYMETLDCTLDFPTDTWGNMNREVRKELVVETTSSENMATVSIADNRTSLGKIGNYVITFPYEGTLTANIVGYVVTNKNDPGTLVKKSHLGNGTVIVPVDSPCSVTARSNAKTFVDNTAVWSVGAIRFVTSREILKGTAEGVYSPNVAMTRAMIVTILYRLEGSPAVASGSSFMDVPATFWAADAMNWAVSNNIVSGYGNGMFGPNDLITREQLTKILFNYSTSIGMDTSHRANISEYTDIYDSPDWAKDAMSYAVAMGLIYGDGQNTLNPKGVVTRAQMAVVLQRVIESMN